MDRSSVVLLAALIAGAGSQMSKKPTGQFFNCNHRGQETLCSPGVCGTNGITCDCGNPNDTVNTQGIFCVPVEDAQPCNMTTCNNNGTCLRDRNDTEMCFCDQLYAGPDCSTPRVVVTCSSTSMTIRVTPHGQFVGRMYASRFADDANCRLQDNGNGSWVGTFSLVPGMNNSCGVNETTGASGQEFQAALRVQYNIDTDIYLGTDQLLSLTCLFNQNVSVTSKVDNVDASDGNLSPGTGVGVVVPLDFHIWANGSIVGETEVVAVGQILTLAVALQRNEAYHKFLVEECSASNRREDDDNDVVTLPFVTDGCPVNHSVVAGDHRAWESADGEPVVHISIFAFLFLAGSENFRNALTISCDVLLCQNGSSACDTPTCPAGRRFSQGLGRRRRAVTEEMVTVGQTLTVRFGNGTLDGPLREGERDGSKNNCGGCEDQSSMRTVLAVMGVMGVALLALLFSLLFLLFRRHRRWKGEGVGEASTTSSTATLHLPRPTLQ
ncbi:hypothetical protein ACOMHN_064296 [Nucella lapillus]